METYYKLPKEDVNDVEGLISEVYMKSGDQVEQGDLIYSFETTKANVDVEAGHDGFIHYYVKANDTIEVGVNVCVITDNRGFKLIMEEPIQKPADASIKLTKQALAFIAKHDIDVAQLKLSGIVRLKDIEALLDTQVPVVQDQILTLDRENEFIGRLLNDRSIRALGSKEKIQLYHEHGYDIDNSVLFQDGSILIANEIYLGRNVVIGEGTIVEAPIIRIGDHTNVGRKCEWVASEINVGPLNRIGDGVVIDIAGGRYSDSIFKSGKDCLVAGGAYLNVCRSITLGDHVAISPRAMLFTHSFWQSILEGYSANFGPISAQDDSWVGAAAQVLPNVEIGYGAIVMSGSVVSSKVSEYSMVGGIPAKVLKEQLKKQLSSAQIRAQISSLFQEFVNYIMSLDYKVESKSASSIKLISPEQIKHSIDWVFDGGVEKPVNNDIVIVYQNESMIEAASVLCVVEKSIVGDVGTLVQTLMEFFRRRGIRFYSE